MTDKNPAANTHIDRALTENELDAVAGGADKKAPPPKQPTKGIFEISDYSFDIEQIL